MVLWLCCACAQHGVMYLHVGICRHLSHVCVLFTLPPPPHILIVALLCFVFAYSQVDDDEVAAVAKAQRDLLADAPNLESAAVTDKTQPKLGPHDFEILRVVGQGAFGKVGTGGGRQMPVSVFEQECGSNEGS